MRKQTVKSLINANWQLCREIVRLRSGNVCEICESPFELQTDHCFSRTKKQLFYEIANLTLVCASCHTAKTYNRGDANLAIFERVQEREGVAKFYKMREVAKKNEPMKEWNKMVYHEQMNIKLKEIRAEFLQRT